MRKKYPSDITRKQFQKIRPLLEKARKKTKAENTGSLRCVLWSAVGIEKRLPMENAAERFPEVEKRPLIL
jgi:hypothetical protein